MPPKFVDYETTICAKWLNAVDDIAFGVFDGAKTPEEALDNIGAAAVGHTHNYPLYQAYLPNSTTVEIDRFDRRYWRADGPRSMSFCVTSYLNGFQGDFTSRRYSDFSGVMWTSEDTKDHALLAYSTNRDYRNLVWTFDIELSATMPVFNQDTHAAVLTLKGRDEAGDPISYYIAIKNYMPSGQASTRQGTATIDFNTVLAGFDPIVPVYAGDIDELLFGMYLSGYDKLNDDALPAQENGYFRVTNSVVTGSNSKLTLNIPLVPIHDIGMSTSYDDMSDLNPQRVVENLHKLGYRGWINHYVGMSAFPGRYWNSGAQCMLLPKATDGKAFINPPCVKWHQSLLALAKQYGYKVIQSVSMEMFSEYARTGQPEAVPPSGYAPSNWVTNSPVKDHWAFVPGSGDGSPTGLDDGTLWIRYDGTALYPGATPTQTAFVCRAERASWWTTVSSSWNGLHLKFLLESAPATKSYLLVIVNFGLNANDTRSVWWYGYRTGTGAIAWHQNATDAPGAANGYLVAQECEVTVPLPAEVGLQIASVFVFARDATTQVTLGLPITFKLIELVH